ILKSAGDIDPNTGLANNHIFDVHVEKIPYFIRSISDEFAPDYRLYFITYSGAATNITKPDLTNL
ncbi:hypothetical protein ACFL2G_02530, partial [Candidatus Omnitrophota bacterium]